jgi:hypothetical protein
MGHHSTGLAAGHGTKPKLDRPDEESPRQSLKSREKGGTVAQSRGQLIVICN